MSAASQVALAVSLPYLQPPMDDLESFYWVAMWAVMNNTQAVNLELNRSPLEALWRKALRSASERHQIIVFPRAFKFFGGETFSPIAQDRLPVLQQWFNSITALRRDWYATRSLIEQGMVDRDLSLSYFHAFAFRGVADVLEICQQHHMRMGYGLSFLLDVQAQELDVHIVRPSSILTIYARHRRGIHLRTP